MKTFLILLCFSTVAHSGTPGIVFENRPERGIPPEARAQQKVDPSSHGTLAEVIGDSINTITVRYFSDDWPDEEKVKDYLAGLVTDERTAMYTFQIWSQPVGEPEIECIVTFDSYTQGRLLIWGSVACLRDEAGKWWFVSAFDYYHRNHPKGNRELARDVPD